MNSEVAASEERLSRLSSYLKQDPANPVLAGDCGSLALDLGRYVLAAELIAPALQQHPDDPVLVFQSATADLGTGQTASAIHQFESLLANGHDNPKIRYNLAYALGMDGRSGDAIGHLEQSVVLERLPEAEFLLARMYHHAGRLEEAMRACERYLDTRDDNAEANGYYALLLTDNEDFEAARPYIARALSLQPDQYEALVAQGMVDLAEGDVEAASAVFDKVQIRRDQGRFGLGMGLCLMAGGKLEEAEQHLLQAVQTMPGHLGSWNALAWCQLVQGRLEQVEQSLEQALQINRNFGETHGTYAVLEILRQNFDSAEKYVRRAEHLQPDSFALAYARSLLVMRHGNQAAARQVLTDALGRSAGKNGMSIAESVQKMAMHSRKVAQANNQQDVAGE